MEVHPAEGPVEFDFPARRRLCAGRRWPRLRNVHAAGPVAVRPEDAAPAAVAVCGLSHGANAYRVHLQRGHL